MAQTDPAQSERDMTADERRWLRRLQRTLDAQPASLTIYCHGDTATALDREAAATTSEFDKRDAIIADAPAIRTRGWMAGDF